VYLVVRNGQAGTSGAGALTSGDTLGALRRTLLLAATVAAAASVLGTALAWLVTRAALPLRRVWRVLAALPLVVPSFVGALALIAAFAPGGLLEEGLGLAVGGRVRGYWAAFVVLTLFTYPYVYLPVAARLGSLPASHEEAARSLGRNPQQVFASVVLPQITGAIAAGGLLVFLYVVSDFGAVSLLRYDTLTTRIESDRLFDRDSAAAMGLVLALVALVLVVSERALARRRAQIEAVATGRPGPPVPLGRATVPALGFVALVVTGALLVPLTVLGYWAWRGLDGRAGAVQGDLDVGSLVAPALNTAGIGVIAALVTAAALLPVAYLTVRHRSRVAGTVNALVVSGFALPGLVIALALVFWVLQAPLVGSLYQTFPLLVFAYVVHFGAQALRASQVAVAGVPRRLDDAARGLGAGRARRLATIDLPIMLPGLGAGAGLVLLSTMKELPATLFLAPIGFDTLATRIWGSTQDGFLAEAGLAALVLVVVSGALTWFLIIRHLERTG